MRFSTKRWFTIWEVLIIIIVISVWLLWVIFALNKATNLVQKTREKTIAINLARQWMESIFQIRDSNWLRWAGKKEQCWLKKDPLIDEGNDGCENDERMWTGNYYLINNEISGQIYFILSGENNELNIYDGVNNNDLNFSLCESGGNWIACPGSQPISKEWKYWREIRWIWLFLKDTVMAWWIQIECENWSDQQICGNESAKEYRFCSKVEYFGSSTWEVQLCGLITNFKK